ncbi:hypothetical protein HOG17_04470 [Candidatus Peregrinibacteria bacterium]|jgi:hypothetical protein|nr:hypothetical protein [Candidatus Peregrinibacteria bacterium]MBT4366063.1 hypothetical protein [Candidatus Peregrinibacteria bacterium]MBT4455566.1 hypothetical protein [Candidatus Peregrinibacteria bacterium]
MSSNRRTDAIVSTGGDCKIKELCNRSLPARHETNLNAWVIEGRDAAEGLLGVLRFQVSTVLVGLSDDLEADKAHIDRLQAIMDYHREDIRLVAVTGTLAPEVPEEPLPVDEIFDYRALDVEQVRDVLLRSL